MRNYGQALIEFAFILPLLLFIILGATEVGFLIIEKAHQDRSTSLVAEWAAIHPNESWNAVANKELPGCHVEVTSPLPDLVQATSVCRYQPMTGLPLFGDLELTSQESAVSGVRSPSPVASPS